jgi:FtsP/CotA-like multicopper oxidase with cupredoxin domain
MMHTNLRTKSGGLALLLMLVILLGAGLNGGNARAATLPPTPCTGTGTVTCNLWAKTGTLALPNAGSVTIWGYAASAAGAPVLPGPALIVNQGDTVTVNLTNNLTEATALLFVSQPMVPDLTGVAPGGTKAYTFTASQPGTYLYQAGPLANAQHQLAMGLYGALIVRPATAGQAYNTAATAFQDETVVVLSEIDPVLNNSATPASFDLRDYAPKYSLINGKASPNTDPIVVTAAGNKVLLRYVNAGIQPHSMAVLGLHQTAVAIDGSPYQYQRIMVAETIGSGQTADTIATVPATTVNGSKFALYDSSFTLHNNAAQGTGGMLTFLTLGTSSSGGDTTGPSTGSINLTPATTNGAVNVSVTAPISDVATGNSNVTAAEYFVDAVGANGGGAAMSGTFGAPTVNANATLTVAQLAGISSGNHTIYVHGQDSAGNWGPTNFAVLNLDKTGPATTGLGLQPNPSNGSVSVVLSATGDDGATGNSNIQAAEYFIGATGAPGTGTAMTVNTALPVASLTATIPAATVNTLVQGSYVVSARSRDALGNWGALATVTLKVDKTGPATSSVSAVPNPNNGTMGVNSNTAVVRVSASFSDGISNVSEAEGFIDTVGANGAGFHFVAGDGIFNSPNETGRADIPLPTIAALSQGNHTIYVRSKDSAGNWGSTSSTVLVIDKLGPTVSGLTLNPTAANNTAVAISAAASDVATGNSNIVASEYFIDTVGANGTGTALSVSAAAPSANLNATIAASTVAALTAGNHTIYVQAKDAVGNWSARVSATLLIDRTSPTLSGITLTPNSIAAGTASVNLAVNGATDPLIGGLASGITGGEYWICPATCANPGTGGGTAFAGLAATVPTGSLAAGHQYTVRTRIRDAAGNWSSGINGIRSSVLTVTTASNLFTNGFESGSLPGNWSSRSTTTFSRLNATTGATLFGAYGMQAQGNNANYVQYNFSPAAAIYDARFRFNPNNNASTGNDVLATATTGAFTTQAFQVRYRRNGAQPQVQIQVGATANAAWVNINNNASNTIEVVWQSGSTLQLYVNNVLAQTLTATANSVAAVRLGSVTSGGSATLMYFDAFASKSTASPVIGP